MAFPLDFPNIDGIEAISIRPRKVAAINQSVFTYQQEVQEYAGEMWEAEITLPIMRRADAAEYQAFMLELNGMVGTFLLGDPIGQTARGVAGGTPLVNGAAQTGKSLVIDGAPTSTTGWLLKGDYISVGSGTGTRLHMLTADVDTDASGNATLNFWPSLRTSPADNDPVTIEGAKGVFRLSSNDMGYSISYPNIYNVITLNCMEAL